MLTARISILTSLLVTLFAVDSYGQRPLERLQKNWDDIRPRGKLLKQLFGDDEDKQEESKSKPRQSPTPATRSASAQRSTQSETRRADRPTELGIEAERFQHQGLVISQINPRGAGYLAGLRRGDRIVSVGEIDVSTEEELQGIVDVLQAGDEIEFEIDRRGRKSKIMVPLGDPKEAGRFRLPNPSGTASNSRASSQNTIDFNRSRQPAAIDNRSRRRTIDNITGQAGSVPSRPTPNNWAIDPPTPRMSFPTPTAPGPVAQPPRDDLDIPPVVDRTSSQIAELRATIRGQQRIIDELRNELRRARSDSNVPASAKPSKATELKGPSLDPPN